MCIYRKWRRRSRRRKGFLFLMLMLMALVSITPFHYYFHTFACSFCFGPLIARCTCMSMFRDDVVAAANKTPFFVYYLLFASILKRIRASASIQFYSSLSLTHTHCLFSLEHQKWRELAVWEQKKRKEAEKRAHKKCTDWNAINWCTCTQKLTQCVFSVFFMQITQLLLLWANM